MIILYFYILLGIIYSSGNVTRTRRFVVTPQNFGNFSYRNTSNDDEIIMLSPDLFSNSSIFLMDILDMISYMSINGYKFSFISTTKTGMLTFSQPVKAHIPQILHQTWKTADLRSHSIEAVDCKRKIDEFASDYLYLLWTDEDIAKFIVKYYPMYSSYYYSLNMNIKRSDIARYLIVHQFGGLYLDLDIELKKDVQTVIPSNAEFVSYISREFELKRVPHAKEPFAGNAFFAAIPGSKIIAAMLNHSVEFKRPHVRSVYDVLRHTG